MTQNFAARVTQSGIVMFINGTQYQITSDHPGYLTIRDRIQKQYTKTNTDLAELVRLADSAAVVSEWLTYHPRVKLRNQAIELDGVPFSQAVSEKVLAMIAEGNEANALCNFLMKVRENPSKTAQDELLLFCVANGFMIHADGDILAYKGVRDNYMDIHSGKIRNAVGDTVRMERWKVNDNRDITCSTGLHFAAFEYASTWSGSVGRVMLMKINPKNVVSIPSDYNNQKGRCSEYTVIAEIKNRTPLVHREVYTNEDICNECEDFYDEVDYCIICGDEVYDGASTCYNCDSTNY